MSGCSDDAASAESPAVGTDFTRDFYRLVKFESSKSLASTSSRSLAPDPAAPARPPPERELALHSVLSFIAQQQQYCASREQDDLSGREGAPDEAEAREARAAEEAAAAAAAAEAAKESGPRASPEGAATTRDHHLEAAEKDAEGGGEEQGVEQVEEQAGEAAEERALRKALEGEGEHRRARPAADAPLGQGRERRVMHALELKARGGAGDARDACPPPPAPASPPPPPPPPPAKEAEAAEAGETEAEAEDGGGAAPEAGESTAGVRPPRRPRDDDAEERPARRAPAEVLVTVFEEEQEEETETSFCRSMTESFTSTVSTPDTVVCPSSTSCPVSNGVQQRNGQPPLVSPDAAVSPFHERTTSKDVIDELNRMIRKGEDAVAIVSGSNNDVDGDPSVILDIACCCPTGWVHVERDIDFTDPKARANLLDVMLASSGSSGNSSGSSTRGGSGSSSSSESGEEPVDYQHLHRLHRFRRQKKASATREQLGVLRYPASAPRPSILGRDDFYVRYGDKEREAVASFDFLEDLSTTSVSGASSCDTLGTRNRSSVTFGLTPCSTQTSAGTTPSSPEDSNTKCGYQISSDSIGTETNFSTGIETAHS